MPLLEVNTITIEVQYNNYSRSEVIVFFTLQAQQAALARGFAVQHPSALPTYLAVCTGLIPFETR